MSESLSHVNPPSDQRRLIDRVQLPALAIGVVALAICVAMGLVPSQRPIFFRAYLFGWLFWLAVPMGSMAMASLHYMTGGNWGRLLRPVAESAAAVLPLNAILFIPMLFGLKYIYPWATDLVHHDSVLIHRAAYMNPEWFGIRFVIYFVCWIFITFIGIRTARNYDRNKLDLTYDRLRKIGAAYLVFYIGLMTLAAVDWIMSREPHWTSTIFGFIIVVDQALTAMLILILVLSQLVDRPPLNAFAKREIYNDLGNLLLMLVVLWAYLNFAQYLIVWTGNEQEDVGWYVQRSYGGWKVIAGMLIFLHFLVPFVMLLSRDLKQSIKALAGFSVFLLVMRVLDLYWLMTPSSQAASHPLLTSSFSVLEILAWVGIGGIYMAAMVYVLFRRSLVTEPFPEEIDDEKVSHGHQSTQPT